MSRRVAPRGIAGRGHVEYRPRSGGDRSQAKCAAASARRIGTRARRGRAHLLGRRLVDLLFAVPEQGAADEVLLRPKNARTASFLARFHSTMGERKA